MLNHDQYQTPEEIDKVVWAWMPSEKEDKELFDLVNQYMIHHCTPKCSKDGKCKKGYPKELVEKTYIDNKGYVHYRRNHDRVVPYNPALLLLFRAHINVEIAATVNCILYLYKYLYKGPDRVRASIIGETNDELQNYVDARYMPATEAMWGIFSFDLHSREPTVMVLPIHLEGKDQLIFDDSATPPIGNEANSEVPDSVSKLELYFHRDNAYASLKYTQFWENVITTPRPSAIQGAFELHVRGRTIYMHPRNRGEMICRMTVMYPSAGEPYYLRLLLQRTSPRNFVDARTVEGTILPKYQAACQALGLLDQQNEHELCFEEAVRERCLDAAQLRSLFVILTVDGGPARNIFDKYEHEMATDYLQFMSNESARNALLEYLQTNFGNLGKSLEAYGLPSPSANLTELQYELQRWNADICHQFLTQNAPRLGAQQAEAYRDFTDLIQRSSSTARLNNCCFLHGRAGCGKTFLLELLIAFVRSKRWVALVCATTALAALIYDGGTTAHSLFGIPVQDHPSDDEGFECSVSGKSQRADLIRFAKLIVWDEFSSAK